MKVHALAAVEDLLIRTHLEEAAVSLGLECEFATSGSDALRRAQARQPAVIFLDLTSPRFGALALLKRLRGNGHPTVKSRIVGFVSQRNTELQTKAHDLGCHFVYPRSALAQQRESILRQLMGG